MAAVAASMDIQLLKRTQISVLVDEALPDLLVVTYEFGVKIFKGVLLDTTKKNLPCGIQSLNPAFKTDKPANLDDDALFSVNQRFTYTDPNNEAKKRNVQIPSKYKNSKSTVRLRPRQVLCSKCKGICNENSENVSRKRKTPPEQSSTTSTTSTTTQQQQAAPPPPPPPPPTLPQPPKRGLNAPVTRSFSELTNRRKLGGGEATLVPKLTRLTPQEELNALSGNITKLLEKSLSQANKKPLNNFNNRENQQSLDKKHSSEHSKESTNSEEHSVESSVPQGNPTAALPTTGGKTGKRTLRKKRSVGSMEDLWDESILEDNKNKTTEEQQLHLTNTRTIKISYGPQGEGTVLKIPAQIENIDDTEENVNIDKQIDDNINVDNKAARRALKKAKKEAKKKVGGRESTCYSRGNVSPRYGIGSPRYTVGSASPRHGLGNNSPRYICNYETVTRRRKHKMKHKKKHREDKDRKHKEGEVSSTQEDPKECVTQKLSINLKRLNNAYTSCSIIQEEENTSSSDEHNEQSINRPQTPTCVRTADGYPMIVGDVVWARRRLAWWPAKVETINYDNEAHINWYGYNAISVLQCDKLIPYLENFEVLDNYSKMRYDKSLRGVYKVAVKKATMEARENAELRMRQPLENSPSHNIMQVVPPALASPREIDVVS